MIDLPLVVGRLDSVAAEEMGASNVKLLSCVPTIEPTVTKLAPDVLPTSTQRQCALVADVHVDVAHTSPEIRVDAVNSDAPKLRPVTVTDKPPVCPAFLGKEAEMTAASKVRESWWVPAMAATVVVMKASALMSTAVAHATEVAEDQAAVLHAYGSTETVAERSYAEKLRPVTVTDAPPVTGKLVIMCDRASASNENCPV